MKTTRMMPRNKRPFSGKRRPAKRSVHVKGNWKAVEIDPSVFSEEGMETLVCFEELTDYRLVDPEKAAAAADKQTKEPTREKKKKTKRKASEAKEAGEKVDVEGKDGENAAEPVKKKAKNKRNKKQGPQESDRPEETAEELLQNDVAAGEEAGDGEKPPEEASKDVTTLAVSSEAQLKPPKKSKKKRKKKPIKEKKSPDALPNQESKSEPQAADKEKAPQEKVVKHPKNKKQIKNWTNAARSDCSDKRADVSAWKDLFVPSPVLKALSSLGFSSPSPIQALALPPAIRDRMDILGAAETGSGKTLAFGIPMIHAILEWRDRSKRPDDDDGDDNAESTVKRGERFYLPSVDESTIEEGQEENVDTEGEEGGSVTERDQGDPDERDSEDGGDEKDGDESPDQVIEKAEFDFAAAEPEKAKAAAGRSQPLLGLVLTPTRELAVQVKHHIDAVAKFTDIKTAIVVGGMAQEKQRRMLRRRPEIVIATPGRLWDLIQEKHPHLLNLRKLKCLVIDEADRMVERGHFAELENLLEMLNNDDFNPKRQTFVFSATLTMDHSMPTRLLQKKRKNLDQRNQLETLMSKVGIKSKPKIIDLTRKEATVESLTETQIHCQKEEKDFYLYYFLLQYPGRTMVFANSIDCIKRLSSLLVIMDCTPLPLHANMHQKQRLKNLERFAERESCVLLTTDVAARGLDIPNVEHVIHYQVPRTSETYVHRSGRTARATKEGLSLLLVGPDDMMNFKKIYKALGKDEDLPMFPIETKCMEAIKERVNLAHQIEKIEFYNSKEKQHNSWFKQAAAALELELDEDLLIGRGNDDDGGDRGQQRAVKGMKKHLKHLISQPVFRNMNKSKYPTQMGRLSMPHLPVGGRGNALTSLSTQEDKRKLKKKAGAQQRKKEQQQ